VLASTLYIELPLVTDGVEPSGCVLHPVAPVMYGGPEETEVSYVKT